MAAEWGWNPEAVGAIGSAAGALLAAVAACIAVWAGVIQPQKMQHELQRRQLLMLGPRLRGELSAMHFQIGLQQFRYIDGKHPRSVFADVATVLQCPVLSESLASGVVFPEEETRLMAKVQEDSQRLASLLLFESTLPSSMPGALPRYKKELNDLASVIADLEGKLSSLAGIQRQSFIPVPRGRP
nr:hypothetical protein [Comamonas thiooxydans]